MVDLVKTFTLLERPNDGISFSTSGGIKGSLIRIGKNEDGLPAILLEPGESTSFIDRPLKHIEIKHNVEATHKENDEIKLTLFTIIELNNDDDDLIEYFLKVSESIVSKLPDDPSIEDFKKAFQSFVKIFEKMMSVSNKTVQGLWAELLFISLSESPDFFIESWHSDPNLIYDFSHKDEGLEIKSTQSDSRESHFSLLQLNPPEDFKLIVVSFIVNKTTSYGKSIQDLTNELSERINIENRLKLLEVIAQTLGETKKDGIMTTFDFESAMNSIKYFDVKSVPKINKVDVPDGVSGVKFKSNLRCISGINKDDLAEYGHIYSLI